MQCGLGLDHGKLNEIGSCSLHGRINRGTFGTGPPRAVGRSNLGKPETAAEDGFDISLIARLGLDLFHVTSDARITGKVALDIQPGRIAFDIEVLGQAIGAHAINKAKVNHLGIPTLLIGDFFSGGAKNLARGSAVDIFAPCKGLKQSPVFGEMGHDPQFNL